MGEVYGNAACCIAATASEDCHSGLFLDREPRLVQPVKVQATWSHELSSHRFPPPGTYWCSFAWTTPAIVDNSPLNRRAWVAQERYLSTRIMHFSKEVLFWECLERLANEASPNGLPHIGWNSTDQHVSYVPAFKMHVRDLHDDRSAVSHVGRFEDRGHVSNIPPKLDYGLWLEFISAYTNCAMTKQDDCLVALSGIAQDVANATNDQLVAGLWKGHLLDELCWRVSRFVGLTLPFESCRPAVWRAPTWSWASLTSPIRFPWQLSPAGDPVPTHKADIVHCSVDERPSGQVIRASLLLRCRLIPVTVHMYNNAHWGIKFRADLEGGEAGFVDFECDDPLTAMARTASLGAWLIILSTRDGTTYARLDGLVVTRCAHNPQSFFERIGMFGVWNGRHKSKPGPRAVRVADLLAMHEATEVEEIELV